MSKTKFIPKLGDVVRFTQKFRNNDNTDFWKPFYHTDITVIATMPSHFWGQPTVKMMLHASSKMDVFSVYRDTGYPIDTGYLINSYFLDTPFELVVAAKPVADPSIYCSCGGEAKNSQTFNGEIFQICKSCGKEKAS